MNLPDKQRQFIALLDPHRKMLYKLAFVHCRSRDDRKDLVQEMLIQLWRAFDQFDGRVKFSTWLYRVAANTAISFYRSEHRHAQELVSMEEVSAGLESTEQAFDESNDAMRALRSLLDQMDELNSTLILLYLDGQSHEEIATTVGISVSNVGTRISRIKQKLTESLTRE
jgi:RNA polymerase sigma factor (sigma-70 family)